MCVGPYVFVKPKSEFLGETLFFGGGWGLGMVIGPINWCWWA